METAVKDIVRVLVVDDSPLMCKVLTNLLNADPDIIVVGVANNGKEAVEIVPELKPDIITMDIHMPIMDGFEATKQIMAYNPTPILVVSTSVFKAGMQKVFKAISYGALDVITKGTMEDVGTLNTGTDLIQKIKFLSKVKVIHHPLGKLEKREKHISVIKAPKEKSLNRIVAIAASTGGPQALLTILQSFPNNFPCSIVIVQHITSGFVGGLAEWLDAECHIKVKVAEDSEQTKPGTAYIAPCDLQMRVEADGVIRLSDEPTYNGHRPSGDILLESAARTYRDDAIGIILTGMGRDGAAGMVTIKDLGGKTIAQDEQSCVVFGMPKSAIEMNAADKVLPLENIAKEVVRMLEE